VEKITTLARRTVWPLTSTRSEPDSYNQDLAAREPGRAAHMEERVPFVSVKS